jgi:hypothetical protein
MSDLLSPAAQATWCAYEQVLEAECVLTKTDVKALAAALRTAAEYLSYGHGSWKGPSAIINEDELLAIADELEAQS